MSSFFRFRKMEGKILVPETPTSGHTPVFAVFDRVPDQIVLTEHKDTAVFLTSVNQNLDQTWKDFLECKRKAL